MTEKNNITILYVDDEESNLFLFKVSFQSKYHVLTASSPFEALDLLEDRHDEIIVVISDMRMPEMNGIDFIKSAREKYDNIYYYILTGFDFNNQIDEALKQNIIQEFFTKPFNTKEIQEAIDNALSGISE